MRRFVDLRRGWNSRGGWAFDRFRRAYLRPRSDRALPPQNVRRNTGARPGDVLILTKGIGVGIYSAAFKKQALPSEAYREMIASTTLLNRVGAELAKDPDVHAMTDVTGFGLLGHALEMARGGGVQLIVGQSRVPYLSKAEPLAEEGYVTGASGRNWNSYGEHVVLPPRPPPTGGARS